MDSTEERSAGGREPHHTWTTGYVETRRKNQWLLRQKYILLTYSQVDEEEFRWENIVATIIKHGGVCRIGREFHKDGGVHFHAFCMKEKRFITRSPRAFDVDGYHPNIEPIKRTPHRAWAYVSKPGSTLLHDDIPEPPAGRSRLRSKADEVYHLALNQAKSQSQFIDMCIEGDTRRAIGCFNNLQAFSHYRFPPSRGPEYEPPPGFSLELAEYPEIAAWQQRNVPQHCALAHNADVDQTATSSEIDSTHSRESRSVDGETASTAPTSIGEISQSSLKLPRYEEPVAPKDQPLKAAQHRPKSLCLIGGSKLGKSLVARSFGKHNYFHGMWNLDCWDDDAIYNVFDDLPGQLNSFDYKSFLGAQHEVTVADKYKKKKRIQNGKPCIYISNNDPLKTHKGKTDKDWLLANCIFVHVDKPLCNIARLNLEREAEEKEEEELARVLDSAIAQLQ